MGNNPLITAFGILYICGALLEVLLPIIYVVFFFCALVVTLIKKPSRYKLVKRHGGYVMKKRFFTVRNMVKYNLASLGLLFITAGYALLFRHLGLC